MSLRRIDPYLAADALSVHRITIDDRCWLVRTPDGGLKGCATGALFYAQYGDVPCDQADIIAWAIESTGSQAYLKGFDAGFHRFQPEENPTSHDYVLGLDDGRFTRRVVEQPGACRPALWCWCGTEENQ